MLTNLVYGCIFSLAIQIYFHKHVCYCKYYNTFITCSASVNFVQSVVVGASETVILKAHGYSEREQKEIGALNVCKRLHRRDCLARTIHWFPCVTSGQTM